MAALETIVNERTNSPSAMNRTTWVDLELNADPRCLALVRRLLEISAHALPIETSMLNDIKVAVTEACTNVIKHAFKCDVTKRFGISIRVSPSIYLVDVIYQDAQFDPDAIQLPDLNDIHEGGLGVYIIRKIMDDVVYSTDPPTGMVKLHMAKSLTMLPATGGRK